MSRSGVGKDPLPLAILKIATILYLIALFIWFIGAIGFGLW